MQNRSLASPLPIEHCESDAQLAFDAVVEVSVNSILPGGGVGAGAVKSAEHATEKQIVRAVEKEAAEAAARRAAKEAAEREARHLAEAEAKRAAEAEAKRAAEAEAKRVAEVKSTGRGGRGENHLKPDPAAEGPHSTFKSNDQGQITGHAEWQPNPRNPTGMDQAKRVDTQHANPHNHYNRATGEEIPTPHVHEKSAAGGVRPARQDELPK